MKIKYFRQKNQLTQHAMAALMNITQSYYHKIESGDSYLQLVDFIKICEIFKISMDEFINYEINTSSNVYLNVNRNRSFKHSKNILISDQDALFAIQKYIKEQEVIVQTLISNSKNKQL